MSQARSLLAATGAAAALLLTGCDAETAGPETGTTVAEVWENAPDLAGREVTVSAEVRRIVSPEAFVLAAGDSGVDPLLVVHDGSVEPSAEDVVRVTGTVRRALDFERSGVVDDPVLRREIYETFGAEPYLEGVTVTPLRGE